MKISRFFRHFGLLGALATASFGATASDVNIVFLVDESGSMSGEHRFLQTFVPQLESDLVSLGGLTSSYALVGFGRSNPAPHGFTVGGGDFGNAAEFVTAATGLQTSGATEDGYAAIDYALNNLTFDPAAKVSFVLVTDEDRDNWNGNSLDFATILAALQTRGVALTGILNQTMTDGAGTQPAIATNGSETFIADGSGGFTTATGVTYGSAFGTTKVDYTDLALATQGCVADLNQLRAGGATAQSFSAAFLNCLATAIQNQTGSIANIASGLPLARVVYVNRQIGIGIGFDYRNRLTVRRLAAREGVAAPNVALNFTQDGRRLSQNDLAASNGWGEMTGGAAGTGPSAFDKSRLSFFIGGQVQVGDLSKTSSTAGLDYNTKTINLGVDYLFPNDLLLGVGVGHVSTDANLDGNAGSADISGYSVTLYGSYSPSKVPLHPYIDVTLTLMELNNDTQRRFAGNTMLGSTDSQQFSANLALGLEKELVDNLTVSPYLSLNSTNVKVDGYRESGATPLTIGDSSEHSLTGELGAQLRKTLHQESGKLELIGEVSLIHEFKNDSRVVTVNNLPYQINALDRNYGRIGVGAAKTFNGDNTFEVGVSRLVGHSELSVYTVDARVRVPFN